MTKEFKTELIGCIIDKDHLMALVKVVNEYFGNFHLSISFEDNTKIRDLSTEDLEKHDFANKIIKEIELRSYNHNNKTSVDSDFYINRLYSLDGYQLSFSSSDNAFYSLFKDLIDEWIKNVTVATRVKAVKCFKHSYFLSLITSVVLSFCVSIANIRLFNIDNSWIAMISAIGVEILLFVICFIIFEAIKDAFPPTEIDIGFNKLKQLRKHYVFFITVFLIPLIYMLIGIIVPLII